MRMYVGGRIALLISLSLILLAVKPVFASSSNDERLAAQILQIIGSINVGTTHQDEAEKVLLQFAQIETVDEKNEDRRALTRLSFHVDNEATRLATQTPYTRIDFSVTFEDHVAVEKTVRIYVSTGYVASILQRKRGFGFKHGIVKSTDRSRYVGHNWQSDSHMGRIDVTEDSGSPLEQRQTDWQITIDCLTRIGGCTDARQLVSLSKNDLAEPAGKITRN